MGNVTAAPTWENDTFRGHCKVKIMVQLMTKVNIEKVNLEMIVQKKRVHGTFEKIDLTVEMFRFNSKNGRTNYETINRYKSS